MSLWKTTLSNAKLGEAGERFVRACFVKSGRYRQITREQRLGNVVSSPGKNRLDLMVLDTANGKRYAVSVKNQREFLQKRRPNWIEGCIKMAAAHNALPWIVPSFATPEEDDSRRRASETERVADERAVYRQLLDR